LEIAELYKREGVSPLGGCLPQLLQLPIMFALYLLFNEYFALKNAVFIHGWINDLSAPESIFTLPFSIPFLGDAVRMLQIIMVATQLFSTMTTQATQSGGDNKMKWLPYIMMGVFFFILYNLPSGLVLYWTVQNILTVLQVIVQNLVKYKKFSLRM
ncbi:MAG: membrane protein insertase YidC, partial [Methanobacteriota archaeon]